MFTGYHDEFGREILVGDILLSKDGYMVSVSRKRIDGKHYGCLICDIGDSCRNIPYSLSEGDGHFIIYRDPRIINELY